MPTCPALVIDLGTSSSHANIFADETCLMGWEKPDAESLIEGSLREGSESVLELANEVRKKGSEESKSLSIGAECILDVAPVVSLRGGLGLWVHPIRGLGLTGIGELVVEEFITEPTEVWTASAVIGGRYGDSVVSNSGIFCKTITD